MMQLGMRAGWTIQARVDGRSSIIVELEKRNGPMEKSSIRLAILLFFFICSPSAAFPEHGK
jgi:hypothetical protein